MYAIQITRLPFVAMEQDVGQMRSKGLTLALVRAVLHFAMEAPSAVNGPQSRIAHLTKYAIAMLQVAPVASHAMATLAPMDRAINAHLAQDLAAIRAATSDPLLWDGCGKRARNGSGKRLRGMCRSHLRLPSVVAKAPGIQHSH